MSNKPAKNPNAIFIDSRAAGYDGAPVRIMAVTLADSGKIRLVKEAEWKEQPEVKSDTIVVTDTPNVFQHWGKRFNESEQMQEVLAAYKAASAAGLVSLDPALQRYEPSQVIQTRKIDEGGRRLDFDSMGMNNGHIAVLIAIWTARLVHGGYVINEQPSATQDANNNNDDGADDDMMPFSV